jgi:hypothetical protein
MPPRDDLRGPHGAPASAENYGPRRFNLGDLMILTVALAFGLATAVNVVAYIGDSYSAVAPVLRDDWQGWWKDFTRKVGPRSWVVQGCFQLLLCMAAGTGPGRGRTPKAPADDWAAGLPARLLGLRGCLPLWADHRGRELLADRYSDTTGPGVVARCIGPGIMGGPLGGGPLASRGELGGSSRAGRGWRLDRGSSLVHLVGDLRPLLMALMKYSQADSAFSGRPRHATAPRAIHGTTANGRRRFGGPAGVPIVTEKITTIFRGPGSRKRR